MEVTNNNDFGNDTNICQSENENPKLSTIDECIKSIVKKEGYISCNVVKKNKPADGGNYFATLLEIDIIGKTVEGDKETAIFIKNIRDYDHKAEDLISITDFYKTELFVYKELIPIFNEIQDSAKIPVNERYLSVKCYEESNEKSIILENVAKKGFNTAAHRMGVITLKMAEECVKQLSKLHGLSYVLERRKPDYFSEKIKQMRSALKFGEAWNTFTEVFTKKGLECLDENLKSKIEKKIPMTLNNMKEYILDESIKYCLCHGDYRPDNIMAKVDSKVTAIPVDYQVVRFGCPVFDFVHFIYLSTDRQFRNTHMVYLKNLYYKSLEHFLSLFDMSAESVFPKKTFERIYREKLDYGLAIVLLSSGLFVSEDAEIPKFTEMVNGEVDFKIDDKFKDRLRNTVEEFIDLGFL